MRRLKRRSAGADEIIDDGDVVAFQARLNDRKRSKLMKKRKEAGQALLDSDEENQLAYKMFVDDLQKLRIFMIDSLNKCLSS